jgi:hypothetical protein
MVMKKFILITDMRETVGMEEQVGRSTFLNVDHIVSVELVEAHIAEVLKYNSVINTSNGGVFMAEETVGVVMGKIQA